MPRPGRVLPDRSAGRRPMPSTPRQERTANSTFTWGTDADLAPIPTRPRLAVAPDLILRQLDPAPLGPDQGRIAEDLRALYEVITAGAAAVAGDEESEG